MTRDEARQGRRVVVGRLSGSFSPGMATCTWDNINNRDTRGAGVLTAPAANGNGVFWFVRYNDMRVAIHNLDELELADGPGTHRSWTRNSEQEAARERAEEEEREARRRARDALLREAREAEERRAQAARDRERSEREEELTGLISRLETRIAEAQEIIANSRAELAALRAPTGPRRRPRRAAPDPAPPAEEPKPPEEPGERFLDI